MFTIRCKIAAQSPVVRKRKIGRESDEEGMKFSDRVKSSEAVLSHWYLPDQATKLKELILKESSSFGVKAARASSRGAAFYWGRDRKRRVGAAAAPWERGWSIPAASQGERAVGPARSDGFLGKTGKRSVGRCAGFFQAQLEMRKMRKMRKAASLLSNKAAPGR